MYYITEHQVSAYLAFLRQKLSEAYDPKRGRPTAEISRGGSK